MNNYIAFRMALMIVSIGLMMVALASDLPVNAQSFKPCQDKASEGWRDINGTQIDLTGSWTIVKTTDCNNKWNWTSPMIITEEKTASKVRLGEIGSQFSFPATGL